jgi:tetratricopeptide (TPR) repeat protein
MNSNNFVLSIFAALLLCLPAVGTGDQNDQRLDDLFETLQSSEDAAELEETEAAIWEIWYQSGDQAVDEKMELAAELVRAGNLAAAEQVYTEVIEQLPEFSEGWNRRATVRYYQRDFAGSLSDIEETLRLEPRHFGAIWGLGMILGSQRDYERAILAFERLLEIKPNSLDARPRIELLKQQMAQDSV